MNSPFADLTKAWLGGRTTASGTLLKPFTWQYGNLANVEVSTIYTDWCGTNPQNEDLDEMCMGVDDPTRKGTAEGTEYCWTNRKCFMVRNPVCEVCDCDELS